MPELSDTSNVEIPKPSGERPSGQKGPRRGDPCKGVAAPSQPGTHRPPGRGNSRALADFLHATIATVQMLALIQYEAAVMFLRTHPWVADLHWRLTWQIYELRLDEQRLLKARAALRGERYRRLAIEPPTPLVAARAPSEQITDASRGLARALQLVAGE